MMTALIDSCSYYSRWFKPNVECESRIAYWLVSDIVLSYVSQNEIFNASLLDHSFIRTHFKQNLPD